MLNYSNTSINLFIVEVKIQYTLEYCICVKDLHMTFCSLEIRNCINMINATMWNYKNKTIRLNKKMTCLKWKLGIIKIQKSNNMINITFENKNETVRKKIFLHFWVEKQKEQHKSCDNTYLFLSAERMEKRGRTRSKDRTVFFQLGCIEQKKDFNGSVIGGDVCCKC
jgi:hypothetical protein